ncbi:hypothetical protein SteCoe_8951 [Stentor coeruleus]|uniref:Uncharacterized protein n=1 Tax=Stentor coeruleus TaxID=5963 RepID=A0A1R2CJ20_9CILI|nr:hypothetical protein SteCoe_8951 [Stentor coeruleus]
MSKASPACISKKPFNIKNAYTQESSKSIHPSKLKLKDSVILKIFSASVKKAKVSLRPKDPQEDIFETLVSVEREYVKKLFSIRSKKGIKKSCFETNINTPDEKRTKVVRRKKTSTGNLSNSRKNSSLRKFDSTCSSPKSDALSRVLF